MIYGLGLLIALVGSSLAFFQPLADSFGLVKLLPALIGLLMLWACARRPQFRRTGIGWPLAACAAAFALSLAFSVDPRVGIMGVYSQPFYGAVALIPAALIFFAVSSESDRWPDGALWAAAAVALIEGAACALQLAGAYPWPEFAMTDGRALGTMGSPVFLGAVLAPCLPAAVWLAASDGGRWRRAFGWAAAIGAFLATAACGSRGAWIAAAAGLWGFLAASGRLRARRGHFLALAAVLGGLAAASVAMGKANSDKGRLAVWRIAARAGAERPISGWGPDTFTIAIRQLGGREFLIASNGGNIQASAHDDLLQAWATTGIIGLAAYLWLTLALLAALWREALWEEDGRAAAVFGSVLALMLTAKFNPIPPSAVFIAAALAGSVLQRAHSWRYEAPVLSACGWALGAALWLGVSTLCGINLAAEALHSFGVIAVAGHDVAAGADLVREANELWPSGIDYAARRCELIYRVSGPLPIAKKKEFARRALRVAAAVASAHPCDPSSFELLATAELWGSQFFGPGLARASMRDAKTAADLNPFFAFPLIRWEQAARSVGDRREIDAAASRLAAVQRAIK